VTNVADPLGGSWYVEALTDKIEAEAEKIFDRILTLGGSDLTSKDTEQLAQLVRDNTGRRDGGTEPFNGMPMTKGILRGIEEGWFMSEIAEAAFQYQVALEKGDKKVVGVNCHTESISHELEILRVSHEVEREQVATLGQRRTGRDEAAVRAAVQHMVEVSRTEQNMVPAMLDAVRAEATLGEICDALRDIWGVYREPARF
jgi:methylmalonyl-CoA mutase N-terminal domain/subunit